MTSPIDKAVFFLHVPKTAGTSLIAYLDDQFNEAAICPARHWSELQEVDRAQLNQYRLFRGHFDYQLVPLLDTAPAIITMLRDPVERVISLYSFWRRGPNDPWVAAHPEYQSLCSAASDNDLETFVRMNDPRVRMEIANGQTLRIADGVHGDLIDSSNPALLDRALQHLDTFALTGLVERYDDSLLALAANFGWTTPTSRPKLNVGRDRPMRTQIAPAVLEAIIANNQLDIELYEAAKWRFEFLIRDIMKWALEQRYLDRVRQRIGLQNTLHYTFDAPIDGTGWHSREEHPTLGGFRWTGPETHSTFRFAIDSSSNLVCTIQIISAISEQTVSSLHIRLNDMVIEHTATALDTISATIVSCWIDRAWLKPEGQLNVLELAVEQTDQVIGESQTLNDQRLLGLAINRIDVVAAPSMSPSTELGSEPSAVDTPVEVPGP